MYIVYASDLLSILIRSQTITCFSYLAGKHATRYAIAGTLSQD